MLSRRSIGILLLSALLAALLVGGCSSSSDNTEEPLDDPSVPLTPTVNDPDATPGNPAAPTPDENPATTPGETPAPTPGETPAPTPDVSSPTDSEQPPEQPPEQTGVDMLLPAVAEGSDLERLLGGVKRQVSRTLLDLNRQLSEGTELTDQQETCLGAFDPAVGEQLLAISCGQPLATGEVKLTVGDAAFYDTPQCQASVFNGNTDACQLARASLSLLVEWTVVEGERRPRLTYPGSVLSYAIDDTMLHIENAEPALAGFFKCDIDLASGSASTPLTGQSCESIIRSVADRLDVLSAE